MNPPSELTVWLGTIIGAFMIALIAVGNYIRTNKEKPGRAMDSVMTSVGIGWGDRDQIERLIVQVTRIALAIEILADKRTDRIEEALERLDDQERRDRDRDRDEERERRRWTEPEEKPRR